MTWKLPAVCHGLVNRTDGSVCSVAYDAACTGSPVPCDNTIISSPGTVSTTTTTTKCTVSTPLVSEEALNGTWCSGDLRRAGVIPIEVVSFAGDKIMFLYDGEVYYMQYYFEGNQVYVIGEDSEAENKIGKSFSELRFSYFVDTMLAVWSGEVVGDLTRTGVELDCDPLPGAEVPPPTVDDLANTRWCYAEQSGGQTSLELRFTSSYAVLYRPLTTPSLILPAKYRVAWNSYEIYLFEVDEGFEALHDLGGGTFKIIYYGQWLFMVFQDGTLKICMQGWGSCPRKSFPAVTFPVVCHAGDLVGVEWLVGKGFTGNEYFIAPVMGDSRSDNSYPKSGGWYVGPFTNWYRFVTGHESIPEGPVEYASVYVVNKDNRQERYEVAVNCDDLKSSCFSLMETSSGSSVDQKVLDDINAICKNNSFHIHKTREYPLPTGDYFGALDPERNLTLRLESGTPEEASLKGIGGDVLIFEAVDGLFVHAVVEGSDPDKIIMGTSDQTELILRLQGPDTMHRRGEGVIGRVNLWKWDTVKERYKDERHRKLHAPSFRKGMPSSDSEDETRRDFVTP
ncbi:hypothetical protein FOZ63_023170 [Perkinsus olseni]|uniref:Uncharacterized protein n=1 Tax=Perkinsus olseni TaxID=32597 RepID=A0A7J6QYW6_PEROL|nr:hypothetical protein FOZ63_023170 [Perkinsus olseni]